MKTTNLRILITLFFIFNFLVITEIIHITSNKMSWGWLGYNILAWLVIEIINIVIKKIGWMINLASLFGWFLIAIVLNSLNAIFFYEYTFMKFDRFAHLFLLGMLGTLASYNILNQILKLKNIKLNILLTSAIVFMLMNTLSVLHEIAEYAMERLRLVTVQNFEGVAEYYDTADDLFLVALGSIIIILFKLVVYKIKKNRTREISL